MSSAGWALTWQLTKEDAFARRAIDALRARTREGSILALLDEVCRLGTGV